MGRLDVSCKKIGFGTGECAYNIMLPYFVRYVGGIPILPLPKTVSIDKCLLREILDLWEAGVKTTGCCCGHGDPASAFISVDPDYTPQMRRAGYETTLDRKDHFRPKSALKDNPNQHGFSWMHEAEVNGLHTLLYPELKEGCGDE